jgi:hypothetical protein
MRCHKAVQREWPAGPPAGSWLRPPVPSAALCLRLRPGWQPAGLCRIQVQMADTVCVGTQLDLVHSALRRRHRHRIGGRTGAVAVAGQLALPIPYVQVAVALGDVQPRLQCFACGQLVAVDLCLSLQHGLMGLRVVDLSALGGVHNVAAAAPTGVHCCCRCASTMYTYAMPLPPALSVAVSAKVTVGAPVTWMRCWNMNWLTTGGVASPHCLPKCSQVAQGGRTVMLAAASLLPSFVSSRRLAPSTTA